MSYTAQQRIVIPDRIRTIKPFLAMEIMERAQQLEAEGRRVIHLEIGEPDFDTPLCIKEACIRTLRDRKPGYTHSLGLLELREEVCKEYQERYGVILDPKRVIITSGTSPAMLLAFSVLCHPQDEIIITDPHYPCYPSFIRYAGGVEKLISVCEETGFRYSIDEVRAAIGEKTKAITVNSPANPTGAVTPGKDLGALTRMGPMVVSDEIYHGLVYEGECHSVLEYTDDCFVLNGFSKLYAMTGWRVGYLIAPEGYMRALQVLHQNFLISANSFVQWAAIAAFREAGEEVETMRKTYGRRRKLLLDGLRRLGFGIQTEPTGAFYVLANAKRFSTDSRAFAFEILEHAGVGTTPGIDFGANSEGYIRFTYANSEENIEEALERLDRFLMDRL